MKDAGEFVIQPNPRLTRSNSQDNLHGRKRERVPEANTKRSRQVKFGYSFSRCKEYAHSIVDVIIGSKKVNAVGISHDDSSST